MPKETKEIKPEKDDTVDNSLELTKYATQVQSRIREDINSDFVLAVLNEKDKEAIKEFTNNAYLSKRLIKEITEEKQYKWNKTKRVWELRKLQEDEIKEIERIADETFDIHMIRPMMLVILERNKKENPILSGLMNKEKTETTTQEIDEETVAERIVQKLGNKGENK